MRVLKRNFIMVLGALPLTLGLVATRGGGPTVAHAFDPTTAPEIQDRLLDATADIELGFNSPVASNPPAPRNSSPRAQTQCAVNLGTNIRVNQNCLNLSSKSFQGRAQAQNETSIAVNPNNKNQLLASSNDYRRGDGTCGAEWSNDGGNHWQDATVPNGFVRGGPYNAVREYFTSSGDPSVAFDSKGDAFYSCQEFMRGTPTTNNGDFSSAVYLYGSGGNGGASWTFPGTPVVTDDDTNGSTLVDKPLMTVDNHVGSPFQDRIYDSWTLFASDGTAYIYEAYSSDYGRTFSSPVLVSTDSPACAYNYSAQGVAPENGDNCDENQFSDPFTGSDGTLYIVYNNFNNAEVAGAEAGGTNNVNQFLISISHDGGQTFSTPIQATKYFDLPDCDTYQGQGSDPFRACLPEQGTQKDSVFRASNYASGAVNPTNPGQVIISFGSYVNSTDAGTCTPNGIAGDGGNLFIGVKTSGCGNKILYTISNNANSANPTFSNTGQDPAADPLISADPKQVGSDQWWQWAAFSSDGKFAASYYDRQYGNDETTGSMDISLTSSADSTHVTSFSKLHHVSTASMPLPTEFPNAQGNGTFLGDYTGLAVSDLANPLWMDTRDVDLFDCGAGSGTAPLSACTATEPNGRTANDQDLFTARVAL